MDELIEYHTKYKEIDGIDETIWITRKEHGKLRLLKKRTAPIPKTVLVAANQRTEKHRLGVRERFKQIIVSRLVWQLLDEIREQLPRHGTQKASYTDAIINMSRTLEFYRNRKEGT